MLLTRPSWRLLLPMSIFYKRAGLFCTCPIGPHEWRPVGEQYLEKRLQPVTSMRIFTITAIILNEACSEPRLLPF